MGKITRSREGDQGMEQGKKRSSYSVVRQMEKAKSLILEQDNIKDVTFVELRVTVDDASEPSIRVKYFMMADLKVHKGNFGSVNSGWCKTMREAVDRLADAAYSYQFTEAHPPIVISSQKELDRLIRSIRE